MTTVTVSHKGQVVIPAAMRRSLGIKPGTALGFELDGDAIRVRVQHALPASAIAGGYGMLKAKPANAPRQLSQFDAAQALRTSRAK